MERAQNPQKKSRHHHKKLNNMKKVTVSAKLSLGKEALAKLSNEKTNLINGGVGTIGCVNGIITGANTVGCPPRLTCFCAPTVTCGCPK